MKNEGKREQGSVKWFNAAKGFGFIGRSEGDDVFVHYSGVRGDGFRKLDEGDLVEFSLQASKTKPGKFEAIDVVKV